ncbi:response regulator transcription factor [Thalassomonas sp. RHCl1]|uniref:LuxR C-terminal-related transcriptional regulator n=1 Tax=Thalassomonas sp. RHCl1 TaxID=2995320 RepID=UPI00248B8F3A|nr:response regulator transcription factor [Thalassomonas sp. RHCl1]
MTKVLIADDHDLFRSGLSMLLAGNGYDVAGQVKSTDELKSIADTVQVDIFILDCQMPSEGPVAMLQWLRRKFPESKVVFLTGLTAGGLFRQLINLKASALVSKVSDIDAVLEALAGCLRGEQYISEELRSLLEEAEDVLTPKEAKVFEYLLQGRSNREIAEVLFNSERTINIHRTNIMKKFHAHSIVELIDIANKKGYYKAP